MTNATQPCPEPEASSLLADDLETLIRLFNNGWATNAQKDAWPVPPDARSAIGHLSFGREPGRDGRGRVWKPLRLLPEAGGDSQPLSDVTASEGREFFRYNTGRIPPSSRTLARIAVFFGLDVYQATLLLVKGAWEEAFAAHQLTRHGASAPLAPLLADAAAAKAFRQDGFVLDEERLFAELEQAGLVCTEASCDREGFAWLARQMMLQELHLAPIFADDCWKRVAAGPTHFHIGDASSPALRAFTQNAETQRNAYAAGSAEQQQAFFFLKLEWSALRESVDSLGFQIEGIRQRHRNIEHQWNVLFGRDYVDYLRAATREARAGARISLKLARPELTLTEIEQQLAESEGEGRRALLNEELKVLLAPLTTRPVGEGSSDAEAIAKYDQACRAKLRQIKWLIHPDRLPFHPGYLHLTDEERAKLADTATDVMKIDPHEVGFRPGQVGWDHPSLDFLERVYDLARTQLELAGLEVNPETTIPVHRGISDAIAWLEREVQLLESEKHAARRELAKLDAAEEVHDGSVGAIAHKRSDIADTHRHPGIRAFYANRAAELNAKAQQREDELVALFAEEVLS